MAATVSITGTWTPIVRDTAATETLATGPNTRHVDDLSLAAFSSTNLATGSPDYPELASFIQQMAVGIGASEQSATLILHQLTKMLINRWSQSAPATYGSPT